MKYVVSLLISSVLGALMLGSYAKAQTSELELTNPSFEAEFEGWSVQGRGEAVTPSGEAKTGSKSAKITAKNGLVQQAVILPETGRYTARVNAKGPALIGIRQSGRLYFERKAKSKKFEPLSVTFPAEAGDEVMLFLGYSGDTVRYDDVSVALSPDAALSASIARQISKNAIGEKPLIAGVPPAQNFDLLGWNLSVPTDEDGNGKSDTISERRLAKDYTDERFFFTAADGGMTFRAPIRGAKTSTNTSYTRVELREMLRRGDTSIKTRLSGGQPNKNNWVFSSASERAQDKAGGIDGVMTATLKVDYVPLTGNRNEIGRVIIGQIHAKDDEPIRLYYRKLPQNERGAIYYAHEAKGQADDLYFELLGSRSNSAPDPADGIKLGERFSYRIDVTGNQLNVSIIKEGLELASHSFDMSGSGYDVDDDYHYFKAGAYNQNKSGDEGEYSQVTFYKLNAKH